MLFTDAQFVSSDDLFALDSDALNVAQIENITADGFGNFIQSAIEEAAATLEANFQNFDYSHYALSDSFFNNSLFAFQDSTPTPRMRLGQVVVDAATNTYASPLKRWVAFLALRNLYQMASNRFVGAVGTTDRYQQKMTQIQKDIDNKYWPALKSSGLPIVYTPVACPGAVGEVGVGTWSLDVNSVTLVAGDSGDNTQSYYVAITYTNADGIESGPSATISQVPDNTTVIEVDISSLVPNPVQVNPIINTLPVVSWTIYAGVTNGTLYKQITLPIGTTSYTFPGLPVLSGPVVGRGQTRDVNLSFINAFFRG